jgi:hypothetical protein
MTQNQDFSDYEVKILRQVVQWHQSPSNFSRALHKLGSPVERLIDALPAWGRDAVNRGVEEGMKQCLDLSRHTFDAPAIWRRLARRARVKQITHFDEIPLEIIDEEARRLGVTNRLPVIFSGVATGFIGLPGAIMDIPATITMFFRNIQTVCACYGIDPADPSNAPYFLWLLSSGSPAKGDEASDTGYIMTRLGLGLLVKEAQKFVAAHAGKNLVHLISKESAPVILKFLNSLLARLGIQMSEKVAVTILPIVSAVAAAGINAAFMRDVHQNALMAGRTRYLVQKHGEESIRRLLTEPSRLYLPGAPILGNRSPDTLSEEPEG